MVSSEAVDFDYAVLMINVLCRWVFAFSLSVCLMAQTGIFEGHGDVGTVLHPGAVEYDAAAKT